MQKQRKLSGSLHQDYLPLYFRGDAQLLQYLDLKFQATINLQKQHIFSLPLKTFNIQRQGFVQPIAQIQTIDELSRQTILKNKSLIKQAIFYVYFPSSIRVDQKIFKIYDKNYENLLKDIPKNCRTNFAKFIVWQQATGQQSIQFQKQKLQQALSNCIKTTIEKKLEEFTKQIATFQSLQLNQRVLRSLFVSRNKVASIYKQLKLTTNACEHYSSLFNEIVYNFKKFLGPTSSKQLPATQKTQYKSPFIIKDINKVFTLFESRNYLLHITNFCFIKMLESHLDALQHYEAIKRFKQYIDFVLANILNVVSSRQDDVGKNIWIIQTIDEGYKIMRQKAPATIINSQRQEEYSLMRVSVCSQYRNAIERIGVIFYGLNTYIVFPRNLEYELTLCIKSMHNQVFTETEYPEMRVLNRHHEVNKMLFLSGQPVSETIEAILNNFDSFKHIYVKTLELMEKTLSESPYKKVSWSMKLSVLKATIIYFSLKDQKRTSIASLLQENTNFSYQSKKSVWQKLQIINKVYQLTLCHRYSIKMRVQDLLNIILDDSIIHLQKIWIELVKIVSKLLFDYKKGETEEEAERLNTIEYGEGEEEETVVNRKKRRTTIHHDERKIQVGTLKFISVVDSIDSIENSDQTNLNASHSSKDNNNNKIRLNIQLSNRIISYAEALIQKSKAQRSLKQQTQPYASQQKPLISLSFLIKTMKGQQKTIPFQILQTQDKIIEVQIYSHEVIIFTIEKLLIDISDYITLVYTMPINHDKIEFYSKKQQGSQLQQDYYLNICPQLKINTLQLFSPDLIDKYSSQSLNLHLRKQSASSISSRPNSQASGIKSGHVVYNKLWTPLKFNFGLSPNDQMLIQRIQIHCLDEIHEKVFVGEKQMNFKQISNLKVLSSQDNHVFPLIIFLKPSQRQQSTLKQQANYLTGSKPHKQSINLIPKSLRNRAQSLSRSINSAPSNISIDSNRISIKLHLIHNGYSYEVTKQVSYCKKTPFKVDYRYSQQFEEYTIKNITDQQLQLVSDQLSYELFPYEQLKVFSPFVSICLNYQQENFQSDSQNEQPLNLMKLLKLDQKVNLKTMIKKQHLKPQRISSIWMDLQQDSQIGQTPTYNILQPIRIRSQQSGLISILKWNSNQYQLVGKVQGLIEYIDQGSSNYLDLCLVPTKKGIISLPQISINSKKAIWQNGKTIKIY